MVAPGRAYAVPPPEFGRDGGEFYRHYDKIADQLDDGMVKGLKASLDGLLIFAGLFAAINSSFLALTLPQMSANPVDDTNALLLELVRGNGALPVDLPSKNFSPQPHIPLVNLLLLISLASALIAAFFAVAGKQWLANYQTLDGSGGEKQRGAQLRRSRSAEHWGLVPFLGVAIPLLLQFASIVFAVGMIIYLVRLNRALGYTIMGIASLATVFSSYALFVALWDPYSPYVTPVSRLLKWLGPATLLGFIWVVVMIARVAEYLPSIAFVIAGDRSECGVVTARRVRSRLKEMLPCYREGTMPVHYQADFVRRILTISVDREAVFHAALNIQLVHDLNAIRVVSQDEAIATRFRDMFLDTTRRGVGTHVSKAPSIRAGGDAIAFGGAHLQLVLYESATAVAGWPTDGQSAEEMFQSSEGLAGVLVKGKGALNIELPASCHLMMWLFEAWFGSKSLVSQLKLLTSEISPPPLSLQTTGFIAFAISVSAEFLNTPATQSFPVWAVSIFPSIQDLFWKCRMDDDLVGRVCSALHTFTFTGHWHREQRPSYQVYIALLRAVTAQLRKANRHDENYLEGIVKRALLILRSLEQQLRDPNHVKNALELIIARALRAAAVEIIEACFARAVFRHRGDFRRDVQFLHRSTMCWALCSLAKYLRFVTETTHHEEDENAVALNKTQNAGVLPLVEPIANFIQRATAQLNAPHIPEEHRLYQVITREFMPAYKSFKSLIGEVPTPQRSLFTEILQWHEIRDRRLEVEHALEDQLGKAIAIDTFVK